MSWLYIIYLSTIVYEYSKAHRQWTEKIHKAHLDEIKIVRI